MNIPMAVATFLGITIGAFLALAVLLGVMTGLIIVFDWLFGDLRYPFNVILVTGSSTAVVVGLLGTVVALFPATKKNAEDNAASGRKP